MSVNKTSFLLAAALLAACLGLVGCAHPVSMVPNLAAIQRVPEAPLADKKVGYYLSDASLTLEVTTPGGGGDKVRYFPYRDLEAGLYKALATVFRDVTKLPAVDDASVGRSGATLVVVPEISTMSFSDSVVTWPPTLFTVKLTCQLKDGQGRLLDTIVVEGTGRAEFDEFKANFSLAAVRASDDALKQLIPALRQSAAIRK